MILWLFFVIYSMTKSSITMTGYDPFNNLSETIGEGDSLLSFCFGNQAGSFVNDSVSLSSHLIEQAHLGLVCLA